MDETHDVVVVGGGLAGLTAAATAATDGSSVLVLDSTGRGGRAATDHVGWFRFNRGGHALYRTTVGREVLHRLGVRVAGEQPPLGDARGRLGDQVGVLPFSPATLARTSLLGPKEKLTAGRLLAGMRRWRPEQLAGRSVTEWFDDLGLDGTVRLLGKALVRLTCYVTDLDRTSADLVAVQLQAASSGSVDYLHGGWASLVDGLGAAVRRRGGRIETGAAVRRVVPDGCRVEVEVEGQGGRRGRGGGYGRRPCTVRARRVILAVGSPDAAAALLPEQPAAWDDLGPEALVACLDLGMPEVPAAPPFLLGLDRPLYLGRHAPPADLAPPGAAVEHTLLYLGPGDDPTLAEARAAMEEHCRLGGVDPDRAEEARYLHRMVANGPLPVPRHGGMAGRPGVETGIDGVLVAGDWVGPVGHLADAALASGEAAGREAVAGIDREPIYQALGAGRLAGPGGGRGGSGGSGGSGGAGGGHVTGGAV